MTPEQVADLNWDTKLPLSLADAVAALEKIADSGSLRDLGEDFLHMYINFKNFEAKKASEKTEEERLDALTAVF